MVITKSGPYYLKVTDTAITITAGPAATVQIIPPIPYTIAGAGSVTLTPAQTITLALNQKKWEISGGYLTTGGLSIVNDTNVTATATGSIANALLRAIKITLGWAGLLPYSRGGTGLGTLGTVGQSIRVNAAEDGYEFYTPAGGGTVTSVNGTTDRITSTGGAAPVIDISATFEALLGKVAQRIDQNNASTTSAQLASVISDETGTGALVFASAPTLVNPVVGTQANGDNSTKAASTAYVDAKSHVWGGGIGSSLALSATNYCNIGIGITLTENNTKLPYGIDGTLIVVSVFLGSAQSATGSAVVTHRHNGADSSITFTIAAGSAAGVYSDSAHTQTFTATDTYGLKIQNNATVSSGRFNGVQYGYKA